MLLLNLSKCIAAVAYANYVKECTCCMHKIIHSTTCLKWSVRYRTVHSRSGISVRLECGTMKLVPGTVPGITILLHPSHDMTITSHVVRMSKWTYLPTNSGRYRGKTCNWDLNPPTAMLVQYLSLTDSDTVTTELLYLVRWNGEQYSRGARYFVQTSFRVTTILTVPVLAKSRV